MSIPKIIHYCWFGGGELPERDRECIESWKKYCPDYEIREWNETNYDVTGNPYMHQAYEAKKWGFVPDYARFDIIYQYGGIYLDTDVEVIKPLDPLLEQSAFMGFENEQAVNPGSIIGAVPKHELIHELMKVYADRSFRKQDGTLDLTPSPKIVTDYLSSLGLEYTNQFQTIRGMNLYPNDYFCPKSYTTNRMNITTNTFTIHHFNASWRTPKEKKWLQMEINLRNKLGEEKMERLTGSFVWRALAALYIKGIGHCIRKVFKAS